MSARESIIPVFVPHLGCPNDCVFCNQRRISGAQEPAGVENVKNAIESAAALPRNGAKRQLAFYGGSFTAIPSCQQEALLGAAKEYLDRGEIDAIRLSTRPDAIDGAVLARLKRYGVETIELGAQSLCDEILLLSGRGHTAEDVVSASKQIKAAGFRLILQMMTGLPGDSVERTAAQEQSAPAEAAQEARLLALAQPPAVMRSSESSAVKPRIIKVPVPGPTSPS